MTSIPQELVDMIIDEVGDNKESLQACALASRAFYPRASAHLFERIRLRAFEKRFDAFRDLCHQNPRLAQLVKSLHIIHRREDANLWLSEIIRNVSALTLEQVVLAGCTQLPSFNKLTMLRLIDVKLPRVPQAHELFKNIPRLERLILESISLPEKEDFAPSESPPPVSEHYLDDRDCIHLRELVLRPDHTLLQGSSAFVYRSRAYGVSFSQLEKLTFEGVYNAYGYRALEEIVDTAAESLVSLDMSFALDSRQELNPDSVPPTLFIFLTSDTLPSCSKTTAASPSDRSLYLSGGLGISSSYHIRLPLRQSPSRLWLIRGALRSALVVPIQFGKHWIRSFRVLAHPIFVG